jgi:NitT/TauT family transport system ATP-binding protein
VIEVDRVSKIYTNGTHAATRALQDVSFEVRDGEFVSLLGPSGCGKSTLLAAIAGLLPHSSGVIRIQDHVVDSPQTSMGIVFQNDCLLAWRTVMHNVLLQMESREGRKARPHYREKASQLLRSMGLEGFEDAYPRQLSGGMRQRVSICRALIHDPEIILMDEPFGALDAISRDQLGIDLAGLWEHRARTAVFVTHSIPEAVFLSDRVIVMTPRPGQVADIFDINLERPRRLSVRDTPEFAKLTADIREVFLRSGIIREADDHRRLDSSALT